MSKLFEKITSENIGKVVAIYLDGSVISAPVVREAISGGHLIDKSSDLVATYLILQYVQKIIQELRQALYALESKQLNDQHIKDYLLTLDQLQNYVATKYQDLMHIAHHMERRARYLEAHQLAKMRG